MTAEVRLQVGVKNDLSYLEKCYFTQPLKIANITENRKSNPLRLMMTSSSPGILDKDHNVIQINMAPGSRVELTTQAYQRLFQMKIGASQNTCIRLQENASLMFIAQPCVPHKGSKYRGHTDIYLQSKCRLVFGEIFTCGRKSNNEIFLLSRYQNITQIFMDNSLVIRENILIEPEVTDPLSVGHFEGFTHSANLVFLDEQADIKILINKISGYLSNQNNIMFGITTAPINGFIVKLLGMHADQLYHCLLEINNSFIQNSFLH